jgi:3-oxoacyl-[acyl-carrier protein] reductase
MRRAALLTGVGRAAGIAHGIAEALAADGWDLALLGRAAGEAHPEDVDALVERLEAAGAQVVRLDADLADPDAPARAVRAAEDGLGRPLDGLVLSHSHSVDSSILDTTVESFDAHLAVNARAAWLLIRAFAEPFARSERTGAGRVVALTSDHVIHNLPYGVSKGALDRIVLAAAGELAPLGITANLVDPGPVDTGWMTDEVRAELTTRQPTGRLGTPRDAAGIVRFLLSDEGGWVTGQRIRGDGGFAL